MSIHVHIRELVLEGDLLTTLEQNRLRAAIAAALHRRIADQGQARSHTSVDATAVQRKDRFDQLGEQIAEVVHGGIRHE